MLTIMPPVVGKGKKPVVAMYSLPTTGGHWKYMQALAKHLSTPCVLVTASDSKAFQSQWRAPVLRWSTLPHQSLWTKGRLLLTHIRNTAILFRVACLLDVKLIHIQDIEPISLGIFLPFIKSRFRLILSVHNVLPHRFYSHLTSKLETKLWGFIYRRADALCVFSQYGIRQLVDEFGVDPRRIHFIPMGCHESLPVPEPDRKSLPAYPTFMMFGGYRPNKGFGTMVDAFLEAKEAGLPGQLCVAGQYPLELERTTASRFQKAGFANSLRFINRFIPEDEIDGLMRVADVMVLPYIEFESQSGILYLAYAYNMPLVASRVGGLEEALEADKTGILVEPGSSEVLAKALFQVLDGWMEYVGRNQRLLLQTDYSWERIGSLTDQVYSRYL